MTASAAAHKVTEACISSEIINCPCTTHKKKTAQLYFEGGMLEEVLFCTPPQRAPNLTPEARDLKGIGTRRFTQILDFFRFFFLRLEKGVLPGF